MKNIFKRLLITLILLLASSGVARADTTEIRAKIAAVRIVVVDNDGQVTEIYSNTLDAIQPSFRLGSSEGPSILAPSNVIKRYQEIMSHLAVSHIGKIYQRPHIQPTIWLTIANVLRETSRQHYNPYAML